MHDIRMTRKSDCHHRLDCSAYARRGAIKLHNIFVCVDAQYMTMLWAERWVSFTGNIHPVSSGRSWPSK